MYKKSHNTYNSYINQNLYRHLGLTYEVGPTVINYYYIFAVIIKNGKINQKTLTFDEADRS